jgi:hypothetical protein
MKAMSKIGDEYKVHDSIESARQFEMKHTGRSYWSREEPPPPSPLQPILFKVILLIAAFLLPVLLTLLSFKFIYRAFIIAGLLFLSVETNVVFDSTILFVIIPAFSFISFLNFSVVHEMANNWTVQVKN